MEHVYDELYVSEAFNVAYKDLQMSSAETDCKLKKVICGLIF